MRGLSKADHWAIPVNRTIIGAYAGIAIAGIILALIVLQLLARKHSVLSWWQSYSAN